MKKIILNSSWNPGFYHFSCDILDNEARIEVESRNKGESKNNYIVLKGKEFNDFIDKFNQIDFGSINHEQSFGERGYMLDEPDFDFLYLNDNNFYTARWQIGGETLEMEQIEALLGMFDPIFNTIFLSIDESKNIFE